MLFKVNVITFYPIGNTWNEAFDDIENVLQLLVLIEMCTDALLSIPTVQ